MSEQQTLFIDLPLEARELLAENGVDLIAALRESGLEVTRSSLPPPVPVSDRGKDVVLALVAVGVVTSLVATGIVRILDALGRNKKFLVTEHGLTPVVDASGRPVRDAAGQPVLYWSEKKRLIESTQTAQDKSAVVLEVGAGPQLLKFSMSSGA